MFGDGTYTSIEVGREIHASIEFWEIGQLSPVEPQPLAVESISGRARYRIVGQVISHDDEFFVLDLGVLRVSCISHHMSRFSDIRPGAFVTGKVALALNPFDWDPDTHPRRVRLLVHSITKENYTPPNSRNLTLTEEVTVLTEETVDDSAAYLIAGSLITTPN
jgi:hypothetical protein